MCSLVNRTKIVVFMRGTERRPDPGCPESQEAAEILNQSRVLWDAVNIVTDTNAEMAIREYSGGDTRWIKLLQLGKYGWHVECRYCRVWADVTDI